MGFYSEMKEKGFEDLAKKIVIEFISPDSYFEQDGMNAEDHPKRYQDHCHHRRHHHHHHHHHHYHHHRCHHRHPPNAHRPQQQEERDIKRKKSLEKSEDKSLPHTWKRSTKACLEECRQSLRPKEAIPNTSYEKRMLTNEIIEIND